MKKLLRIILIPFLLWNGATAAQSVAYRNLTTKDGLPSNTVYQIKQDKKGFIWMATANGLVRYDGVNFKIFNSEKIKDKDILGIFIDNNEKIWFWNLTGNLMCVFDEKVKVIKWKDPAIKIKEFKKDKYNHYYFIDSKNGVYYYDGNKNYKLIKKEKNFENLIIDFNGEILGRCSGRIYRLTPEKAIFLFMYYDYDVFGYEAISGIEFYAINKQYIGLHKQSDEIYDIDKNGNFQSFTFQKYQSKFKNGIYSLHYDTNGRFWLYMKDRAFIFSKDKNQLIQEIIFPKSTLTNSFLNDIEGNFWIPTSEKGIYIIPSIQIEMEDNELLNRSIKSIYRKDEVMLVTTQDGVLLKSNIKEKKIHLNHKNPIISITDFKNGFLWFFSTDQATILDTNYNIIKEGIGKNIIGYKSIYFDNKTKDIFIGHYDGVLKIAKEEFNDFIDNKKFEWRSIRQRFRVNGINQRVYAIEKVKNEYWFGSTDGLYYSDGDTAVLTKIPELQKSWITKIINRNDTVWVGTQTDGVFQIINKKIAKVFDEKHGLISNNCKELIVESNGIVWVGTNNGINKINVNTGEIDLIDNLDGLLSNDINALVLGNETVFVGTADGLTTFNKNIQTKNKVAPPIYLSKFQIFDTDTILLDNYVLKYNQNNIRIHVTGVSFRSQGTFKYKYRMRGISDEWTETKSNIMSFPILNPDEYIFEAYAVNEDGVQSEVPIRIKIVVKAPFWQTWWFWFLVAAMSLFITWRVTQSRIKRVEERLNLENEFQQKINQLKMQALQAQMNPHFIFNALNAIQHYLIVGNEEQATIYLAKFAKLIRMIFEYSKGLRITLTDEIDFLKLYLELEKLRFKNKINVNFSIGADIYIDDFKMPSLLIQPIIENSFKHGLLHKEHGSELKIIFMNENGWVKCIIEDNGIGREKANSMRKYQNEKHNSSGLQITEERLNIWINQHRTVDKKIDCFKVFDLKDADGNASGTRVEMILGKIEME